MSTVLVQAVVPTARAVRWAPLAGVAALLALVATLAGADGRPSDTVLAVAAAGLATTVVGGLHDPADRLLAALPVSTMARRAVRLGLLGVPTLLTWWLLTVLASPADGTGPGPLLALTGCGVAVAVWAPTRRAVLLGAATPVAVFALSQVVPASWGVADALAWWLTDPWWVLTGSVLACVAGRRR